jgi:AcrR family transcriptional regulator
MKAAKRPLPHGPHDLTREQVEQSQRERLYIAIIEGVAKKGYAQTSVADVLSRSGVSRATFYELFKDKGECFRAAYAKAAEQIASVLASGIQQFFTGNAGNKDPLLKLEWVLGLYLDMLASQPAFAKAFLVEVFAAGPEAIWQRQASLEQFVDVVAFTLRDQKGVFGEGPDQRFAIKVLVHAVSSMVTAMIGTGETARLPELKKPLLKVAAGLMSR